jgi:protein ImuB
MLLWIAVHLPHLSLEAFSRDDTGEAGYVVIESGRVIASSPAARNAGIRSGMGQGGVVMLAPQTTILERDPGRELASLNGVAMALLQYTPQVAPAEESVLLMSVGASLTLFKGIRALCRRVRADVHALGFTASISCAPTARGAWLLARRGKGLLRTLKIPTLEARLDQLPAVLLPPARRYADWFEGIGCNTIADLRRLPRPGLQRRCGRELLDVFDAAYGMAPEMHEWLEPPETFRAQLELFDRVEKADELLAGAQRLILQLLGWLSARQLAVRSIVLEMIHERGRTPRAPSILEVALGEPTWRGEHLVRLLKEKLGRHQLDAFVIGLALEAVDVEPMAPPNEQLFPDPVSHEKDQQALLEVLAARLGGENVLKPSPRADYRPEVANAWVPASTVIRSAELQANMPPGDAQFPRPTWILAKPIQLLLRNERPFYSSPLKLVSQPERIEAGWWSDSQSRDYFIAEAADFTLYWIYRERVVSDEGEPEPRWFLHGLFG